MSKQIIVRNSIFIQRQPDEVWDFTQDYSKRMFWDTSILKAIVVQEHPKAVSVKAKGNMQFTLVYKQNDRPHKTSLAMQDINSFLIAGGGGSWHYIPENGGTLWTQSNAIVLKNNILAWLLKPLLVRAFKLNTKKSMLNAKRILEGN